MVRRDPAQLGGCLITCAKIKSLRKQAFYFLNHYDILKWKHIYFNLADFKIFFSTLAEVPIDNSMNNREIAAATKRKEKLVKQIKECKDYDAKVAHIALSRIDIDLDDGVKVNYRKVQTGNDGKFCEILADSKDIMVKEK